MGRGRDGRNADYRDRFAAESGALVAARGTFARLFKPRHHLPEDLEITIVSPSERLGDANDAVFWKRENIDRWVDLGARDMREALGWRMPEMARESAPMVELL